MFAAPGHAATGTEAGAMAAGVAAAAMFRCLPGKWDFYLATLKSTGPRPVALWAERARG